MEHRSPYAPPASDLSTAEQPRGSPWKAVALGLLADIGGSIIAGLVVGITYAAMLAFSGTAQEDAMQAFAELDQNTTLNIAMYTVGGLFSVLGGYVCARVAKYNELRLGIIVAVGSALFGFLLGSREHGLAMEVLLWVATFGSVMLGAWMGLRVNRRRLSTRTMPA